MIGVNLGGQPCAGHDGLVAKGPRKALPCLMSLPREIAEKGDGIYKAKYKRSYEKRYFGQYAAIDIDTSEAFVAPSAAAAVGSAQIMGKEGALFHLVRIGYRPGTN
ncbi:MAG: hypothetical protein ACREQX_08660 [Candidatus Binataceae bacterium]